MKPSYYLGFLLVSAVLIMLLSSISIVQPNMIDDSHEFMVTVSVVNVKDMFGWQIVMQFDPAQLECINISIPLNYVFSYTYTTSQILNNRWLFPCPLQKINNQNGTVAVGDCLLGQQQTFAGSGPLCNLFFTGSSSSSLRLVYFGPSIMDVNGLRFNPETFVIYSDLSTGSGASLFRIGGD